MIKSPVVSRISLKKTPRMSGNISKSTPTPITGDAYIFLSLSCLLARRYNSGDCLNSTINLLLGKYDHCPDNRETTLGKYN